MGFKPTSPVLAEPALDVAQLRRLKISSEELYSNSLRLTIKLVASYCGFKGDFN